MEKVFELESAKTLIQNEEKSGTPIVHLFGDYFLKNEICCLFGDSNVGKTILCTDVALSCCGGKCWWAMPMSDIKEKVLYFDFELSSLQFARRYKGASDIFPNELERAELNQTTLVAGEDLFEALVNKITARQAAVDAPKVIIIDNLTYLSNSTTNAAQAIRIMKELKKLKSAYGLSIILVAHCPKRKKNKPITQDDLGGSKMIMNFCDSAFAISNSAWGDDVRYIKHIKARGVEKKTTVSTVEISTKPYLHFQYEGESHEDEHLGIPQTSTVTPEIAAKIISLREEGVSIRDIAEEVSLSKSAVGRFLKKHGI